MEESVVYNQITGKCDDAHKFDKPTHVICVRFTDEQITKLNRKAFEENLSIADCIKAHLDI